VSRGWVMRPLLAARSDRLAVSEELVVLVVAAVAPADLLLVGILVGTYSSVFVASPLVVAFERGNDRAVQGAVAPAARPAVPSRGAGASAREAAAQAAGPAATAETTATPRRRPAQHGSRRQRGRSGSGKRRR